MQKSMGKDSGETCGKAVQRIELSKKSKLRAFGRQCRGVSLVGQGTEASQSVSVKDC